MYERFNERARHVMVSANREAIDLNHEYIGTEHLLLGLLRPGGMPKKILERLGIEPAKMRSEVLRRLEEGPDQLLLGRMPSQPGAKKAIEFALEECRSLNHTRVSTEHILLGLLREEEGLAGQILRAAGLKLEEVREIVRTPPEGLDEIENDG